MTLSENQKIERCHICFWKAGETEVSHGVVPAHHGLTVQSRSGQMPTHLPTHCLPLSQTTSTPDKLVPLVLPSLPLRYSSHTTLSCSSRTTLHSFFKTSTHTFPPSWSIPVLPPTEKSHFLDWDTLLLFLNLVTTSMVVHYFILYLIVMFSCLSH